MKKLILTILISSCFTQTIKSNDQKYITKRDTLILREVDLKKSIDASVLDKKLSKLKWITHHYPNNPINEINPRYASVFPPPVGNHAKSTIPRSE